ncbi:MAG: hypothetical protein AAFV19_20065 [Pseudomonadota bacterium]
MSDLSQNRLIRGAAAAPSAICWFIAAMLVLSAVMDLIYGRPVAYTRAISPSVWAIFGAYFWHIRSRLLSGNRPGADELGGYLFGFIGLLVLLIGAFVTYYSLPGLAIVAIGLGIIGGSILMSRGGPASAQKGRRQSVIEIQTTIDGKKRRFVRFVGDASVAASGEEDQPVDYRKSRPDWAKGRTQSESENERRDGTWFWVAVVLWSLWAIASVLILVFGGDPIAIPALAVMAAIFSASEIYRFVHRLKFTESCLMLDPMPPELRETVTMTVETGLRASKWQPTECTLTFDCVKISRKVVESEDDDTVTTMTDVLWSTKATALAERRDGLKGLVLTAAFEIPSDQPPSKATTRDVFGDYHWRLYVHADLPGLDYRERYLLPVAEAGYRRKLSGDHSADHEASAPWGTGEA